MTGGKTPLVRIGSGIGALLIALLLGAPEAGAQKATEQFIPLGQSPGLSSEYTDIAPIATVDAAARTFTLGTTAGGRTVRITDRTRIWIDRSTEKRGNLVGDLGDLQPGRRAEVFYENNDRRENAAWIKIVP